MRLSPSFLRRFTGFSLFLYQNKDKPLKRQTRLGQNETILQKQTHSDISSLMDLGEESQRILCLIENEIILSVSCQASQVYALKFSVSSDYRKWDFCKLSSQKEMFLNLFSMCIVIVIPRISLIRDLVVGYILCHPETSSP